VSETATHARELTADEIRDRFLKHLWDSIRYWAGEDGSNVPAHYTSRERLEGLTHSILATLDGCTLAVPSFIVAPHPHPEDKAFHQERGEDWFPENHQIEEQIKGDIGGCLHELLYNYRPEGPRRG
jgi:hypothetical protein